MSSLSKKFLLSVFSLLFTATLHYGKEHEAKYMERPREKYET